MMAQLKLQTLLLVLLMALASASPLAQHNESEILLDKRWYSIPLDKNVPPHLPRAWPLRGHKNSVRPVRYCFANEESYQALHKDLCNGIAKWVPATRQSSLVITQDIACGYVQNGKCMCDVDGVELGTLHIFVSSEDTQGATRGYNEPSKEHSHSFPPNSLRFPRRNQPPAPPDTSNTEDKTRAVLMAHELGHVIGLEHENQRPDAHNFIYFDCEALLDYSTTKDKISEVEDEPKFTHDMSDDQKMHLV
ncbi:hypothetical protein E2P81_ATG10437 [Venturia nashicola]|nr:hypothetical protein E2P81_ATG10437 [Venturia nashicola]